MHVCVCMCITIGIIFWFPFFGFLFWFPFLVSVFGFLFGFLFWFPFLVSFFGSLVEDTCTRLFAFAKANDMNTLLWDTCPWKVRLSQTML